MSPLTETEVLSVTDDRAASHTGIALAIVALRMATENAAEVPIGIRDRLLLDLRARSFGSVVSVLCACPGCEQELETDLALDQLLQLEVGPTQMAIEMNGSRIELRQPTTADVLSASRSADPRAHLLGRVAADLPPTADAYAVAERELINRCPLLDIQIEMRCDQCEAISTHLFDIVSILGSDIQASADRVVRQVHALASTYGWSERTVLAMAPQRRRRYLELNV